MEEYIIYQGPANVIDTQWHEIGTDVENDGQTESVILAESTYRERVRYWQDYLPNGYSEQYNTLLNANCSPRVAAAVCQYVAGYEGEIETQTQKEIADEFDISHRTIGNWYRDILP